MIRMNFPDSFVVDRHDHGPPRPRGRLPWPPRVQPASSFQNAVTVLLLDIRCSPDHYLDRYIYRLKRNRWVVLLLEKDGPRSVFLRAAASKASKEPALETPCHRAASSPPPTSHVARANRPPPWPLTRLLSLACLLLLLRAMDLGSFASDDEILPQDFIAESCICGHLLESRVKADWSGRVLFALSMLTSTPPLISETFGRPLVRVHCRRFALSALRQKPILQLFGEAMHLVGTGG